MKITVFGATGGIGRQLVAQALNHGHDVTAVVRDAARLPISDVALHVVTCPGSSSPTYCVLRSLAATRSSRRWAQEAARTARWPRRLSAPS